MDARASGRDGSAPRNTRRRERIMNSPRDERAAERYAYIVHLLVRVGSASLLRPRIRVDSIRATLEVLAPSIDPQSTHGRA